MMMEKAKLELEHEFKVKQLEMSRSGEGDSEGTDAEEAGEDGERPVRVYPLVNRKPVQIPQDWCDVVKFACSGD